MNLYQRWQSIADQFSEEQALLDWKSGRAWTFGQLQQEVDRLPSAKAQKMLSANAWTVDLIFETLRAWRDGCLFCPVEGDPPDAAQFEDVAEQIGHVKMTSGSTAQPKLVLFTAEQLAADAANIVSTMGLRTGWPNLGVISMAHSYGFSNLVTPLLLHGIPLIWSGDPLPAKMEAIFSEIKSPCTLPAVPAMWRVWLQAGALKGADVKLAISAGAPLSLELEQRLYEEVGLKVHNFYGSSECGGIAYDRSDSPRSDQACVGTAMDRVDLQIRSEDGCLVVSSEAVGESYWPPSVGGGPLQSRQFVTADRAEIKSTGGELLLHDRHSDTINVAGRKVAPRKIEAAILKANPSLDYCLVFGVPSKDPERVEEVVACVSATKSPGQPAQLKSSLAHYLENFEMPRHWWFCPDLTPNARGKFPRSEWRQRYLSL